MKTVVCICCMVFVTITAIAQEPIDGIWNMGKKNTKLEIKEKKKGVHIGTIISSDDANASIGMQLLKDIYIKEGQWKGKLYATKKKKWIDVILEVTENTLYVDLKAGIITKTLEWTKEG